MSLDLHFYSWSLVTDYLFKGFVFSLKLTLTATFFGTVIGTFLALARLSKKTYISHPAAAVINTMRAVPLVMLILWFYLLVPLFIGRSIGAELSAYITFSIFESAFFAEIIRSGIQSLPRGQTQAAQALGLSNAQVLRYVILPQAFRQTIPILLTQVIVLFQDSSLVYAIGAYDWLKGFEIAGKNYGRPVEAYLLAAISYFTMCFILSRIVQELKSRVSFNGSEA